MSEIRPYCLSIAGFDPCSGAGIVADIKTFETLQVYGLGVVSALTYQNDSQFEGIRWVDIEEIEKQIAPLAIYPVKAIKIGLLENIDTLIRLSKFLKETYQDVFIIWDPILKATAGFNFNNISEIDNNVVGNIDLLTPNFEEFDQMNLSDKELDCSILLKGGHVKDDVGTDTLYIKNTVQKIQGKEFKNKIDKHGTGCVLSSAVAANIAIGNDLYNACVNGKTYVEKFIQSNNNRLGYHS